MRLRTVQKKKNDTSLLIKYTMSSTSSNKHFYTYNIEKKSILTLPLKLKIKIHVLLKEIIITIHVKQIKAN